MKKKNESYKLYLYTDENGKRHYKSFTAKTKKKAMMLAEQWKLEQEDWKHPEEKKEVLTVYSAIERYIEFKEPVLSAATVRGYDAILHTYFNDSFGEEDAKALTSTDLQIFVSGLSKRLSPKTVRNVYTLLSSSLQMFFPENIYHVTLPARIKPETYCPNDNDVRKIIDVSADYEELQLAVLLAAFGPLRRSEICALEHSDIKGNMVTVGKAMVKNKYSRWVIKQPKTYSGYRTIELPEFVIKRIPSGSGLVFAKNPDQISRAFRHAIEKAGVPHFRFHDLRHYAASIMHAIGVPDQYIISRGGWSTDNVMKTIYRNTIDLEKVRQERKIMEHFEKMSI